MWRAAGSGIRLVMTSRPRLLLLLALLASLVGPTPLVGLGPPAPAAATSVPAYHSLDAAWAHAELRVVRAGWTVSVTGRLTDTRADGDCVYVEALLAVDDARDPERRTADACGGRGSSTRITGIRLTPSGGSRLDSLRVRVCAADAGFDSCLVRSVGVPSERPRRPELRDSVEGYLSMSMSDFVAARARRPAPYDWSADGCSNSPDAPAGFDFGPACRRHDFGYRNHGHGTLRTSPYDATRLRVDERLRSDLLDVCDREPGDRREDCRRIATTYVNAVRRQGGSSFY